MFKFGPAFWLCLLSFFAAADSMGADGLGSMQGAIDVARSSPESSLDTLKVGGKPVYVEEGTYINLYEKFVLGNAEVVLFGVNCGGTGCPNDDLHFLILRRNLKPQVVSADSFYSLDGTVKPQLVNGKVVVGLGYEQGKSKVAELNGGTVSIHLTPQPVSPMSLDHCKWLHEYSMSECIGAKSYDEHCESPQESFSGVTSRGVAALENHPGFVAKGFNDACVTACKTQKEIAFDKYKVAVCNIK